MQLKTQRLCLIPLNHQQLLNYLKLDYSLEKELMLVFKERKIVAPLITAFQNRILPNVTDKSQNYLFSTLWAIIDTAKNTMVGELNFKGEPNKNGEIEIGYGLYEGFLNNGFMTEAVKEIATWAFGQTGVTCIIAKTDITNLSSQKVLIKNNFIKADESKMIEWRLFKPNKQLV